VKEESANGAGSAPETAANTSYAPSLPKAVDRAAFEAELGRLRDREKAHTREGDAIAAARRRPGLHGLARQPARRRYQRPGRPSRPHRRPDRRH
jgi:hypothetical protein